MAGLTLARRHINPAEGFKPPFFVLEEGLDGPEGISTQPRDLNKHSLQRQPHLNRPEGISTQPRDLNQALKLLIGHWYEARRHINPAEGFKPSLRK